MAEHRIELVEALELVPNVSDRGPEGLCDRLDILVRLGQEFVERRIQQSHRDGQSVHRTEDPLEIVSLHRQQLGERCLPGPGVGGQDHLANGQDPIRLEEHVLRTAETDALGPEAPERPRHPGVYRRWCGP